MQDLRPYESFSDDALIALYRERNDNRLLGLVLQRYTALLLGVAFKYLKDKTAASDAVQHILLHAISHFPQEPVANLKGWLYILMRNHCLSSLRGNHYHADEALLQYVPDEAYIDEKELLLKELQLDRMKALLDQLPEQQSLVLRLFYLDNKSYEEVCSLTGFTFMQVKSYIQNGKRKMRILLLRENIQP